jgi:hypothetical protein
VAFRSAVFLPILKKLAFKAIESRLEGSKNQ